MTGTGTRRRVAVAVAVACSVLGACSSSSPPSAIAPSSSPHVPGPAGLDWSTALEVERPEGMEAEPPSIPPVGSGGGLGHPGHFAGQGNPYDVVAIGDALVAVGYSFPGFHAVTWSSTDREHWRLAELPGGSENAFALSIATGSPGGQAAGRAAIVGRIGNDAAAWSSGDGVSWQPAPSGDALVEAPETRMTTLVAGPNGFVAGGWAGIVNEDGRARFWTSPDGTAWTRAAVDPGSDSGRVAAIAAGPDELVAVGAIGPVGHPTGSAVWRSPDGTRWTRVADPDLAAGQMASVAAGGPGYVAVGSDLASTAALVWRSTDGRTWDLAPTQESLTYHGLGITMADVVGGPGSTGLVAVGHFLFGQQYGQGTAWTSPDGLIWTRMPDQAAFGQGEPQAVIADGAGFVSVGTVGAPDNYIPTVWLSPSRR